MEAYDVSALIRDLEELRRLPLTSKAELKAYYRRVREIDLRSRALRSEIPHLVWHYTADGDIRLKDPAYAVIQERELDEALKELRESLSR